MPPSLGPLSLAPYPRTDDDGRLSGPRRRQPPHLRLRNSITAPWSCSRPRTPRCAAGHGSTNASVQSTALLQCLDGHQGLCCYTTDCPCTLAPCVYPRVAVPAQCHGTKVRHSDRWIAGSLDLSLALSVTSRLRGTTADAGPSALPCPVLTLRGACTLGVRGTVLKASRDEVGSLCAALALVLSRWQCIRDPSR